MRIPRFLMLVCWLEYLLVIRFYLQLCEKAVILHTVAVQSIVLTRRGGPRRKRAGGLLAYVA